MAEREDDFPDFFGDSINVAGGSYSFTLTFFASDPLRGEKEGIPGEVVGRVRMSPDLAATLAEMLTDAVAKNREAHKRDATPKPRRRASA